MPASNEVFTILETILQHPETKKGMDLISLLSLSSVSFSLYIPKPEMDQSCCKVRAAVMCTSHACWFIPLAPYKSTLHTGTELKCCQKGNRFKVGFLSLSKSPKTKTLETINQLQVPCRVSFSLWLTHLSQLIR